MPHSSVAVRMKISFSASAIRGERWIGPHGDEVGGEREHDADGDAAERRRRRGPRCSSPAERPRGDRGGDHDRAVREVEHAGDAEDQREAGRTQRVERADGEAVDQDLPEEHASGVAASSHGRADAARRGAAGRVRRAASGGLTNAGNFILPVGELLRPDVDLLAVLPLQHQAGDVAVAGLQAVHVRIALGQERDAADGADVVGLLHRVDELVAVGRAPRALDRVGDHVDLVVGGVAGSRTARCRTSSGRRRRTAASSASPRRPGPRRPGRARLRWRRWCPSRRSSWSPARRCRTSGSAPAGSSTAPSAACRHARCR